MFRDDEFRIDIGRAIHGGDFIRMIHLPTGIERSHPGPLKGVDLGELRRRWFSEIVAELEGHVLSREASQPDRQGFLNELRQRLAAYDSGDEPGFSEEEVAAKVNEILESNHITDR